MNTIKLPEEQTELFGHEVAEKFLLDLWEKDALAGSWLFCGPKGIGKASLAFRLAKFILAQSVDSDENALFSIKPTSLSISETNPVFNSVVQRTNPSLKVIEFALKDDEVKSRQALIDSGKMLDVEEEKKRKRFNEIRVKDIRDAEPFLRLTAGASSWRILIIDAADDMNANAANALLKSLEEPPPRTLMILISHTPGKLLPTIRSRCRMLRLKPIDNNMIDAFLNLKYPDISVDEKQTLMALSDGSLGKVLTLIQHNGVQLFKNILDLISDFPNISVTKLYAFVDKNLKEKEALNLAQDLFLQWLGRVCITPFDKEFSEIISGELNIMQKIQKQISTIDLMNLIEEIQNEFQDIDLDRKQIFVNAFLKLQRGA